MTALEDEFGDVLRKAREGQGLDHGRLARISGVAVDRIRAFERYAAMPQREECDALGRALGLGAPALWRLASGAYHPGEVRIPAGMQVERFTFPGMNSNGYLLHFETEGETLLVDPGGDPAPALATLDARGWRLGAVLLTHGHADHVAGVEKVHARTGAPVYADSREWRGRGLVDIGGRTEVVVGRVRVEVLSTPGHTPFGVTFVFPYAAAACGDTLFAGSLGRAAGGLEAYRKLLASARSILALPAETLLLPGHGPMTAVGKERENNPFLSEVASA